MQKRAGRDVGVSLCGDKQTRAGAGCASVVRGREGAKSGFFFDDEDPIADREGEA